MTDNVRLITIDPAKDRLIDLQAYQLNKLKPLLKEISNKKYINGRLSKRIKKALIEK